MNGPAPVPDPIESARRCLASIEADMAIAIPSCGEGIGILPLLESLWDGMKALGLEDAPVFLSDSSDDLTTVQAARSWSKTSGARLVVDHSDVRRSLKAALNVAIKWATTSVVVFTNADVVIPASSLAALLVTLLETPENEVAVGVALPDPQSHSFCRRAASFQLRAAARVMALSPPGMRSEGAFWAARRSFYKDFLFPEGSGSIADDVELAKAVNSGHHHGTTSPRAIVYKLPAGSMRDFCLQTRRSLISASEIQKPGDSRRRLTAFLEESVRDPTGAVLYSLYRIYCKLRSSRFDAGSNSETWEPSESTKRTAQG